MIPLDTPSLPPDLNFFANETHHTLGTIRKERLAMIHFTIFPLGEMFPGTLVTIHLQWVPSQGCGRLPTISCNKELLVK